MAGTAKVTNRWYHTRKAYIMGTILAVVVTAGAVATAIGDYWLNKASETPY